tara:strand:- start:252 stop:731 length:480 start_codon:yes stop_codon:yes gene_type:complete
MKIIKYILLLIAISTIILNASPSKNAINAAEDLTRVIGIREQMLAGFDTMLPMIDQLADQLNLSDTERGELITLYRDWFKFDLDKEKIVSQIIVLYAENFTVEELEWLTKFYKSPIGKKTLEKLPLLMQEGAKLGMKEAQDKQPELNRRLQSFMEMYKK